MPAFVINVSDGINPITNIIGISGGEYHACAVDASNNLWCWGSDASGQLGDGGTTNENGAEQIGAWNGQVAQVAAGKSHTCLLTTGGNVYCVGDNSQGQLAQNPLGLPSSTSWQIIDYQASPLSGIVSISAGNQHNCALNSSGQIFCWGYGSDGELGNGLMTSEYAPVQVSSPNTPLSISLGDFASCALGVAGGVQCWGLGSQGELGNNDTISHADPVNVVGTSGGGTLGGI